MQMSRPAMVALDLLFPKRCVGCGTFGTFLCGPCADGMERATGTPDRCPNCAGRWPKPLNCPRCAHWNALDGGRAAFEMAGPARRVVHALKYTGVRAIAPWMAERMRPLRDGLESALFLPVPLHRSRTRSRGFNQAEVLLAELGWPRAEGKLTRHRQTRTQVGLHLRARRANVAGAFRFEGPRLDGQTVVLIDDVITTGATANECALVLKDHGARQVHVAAFARASHEGEHPASD